MTNLFASETRRARSQETFLLDLINAEPNCLESVIWTRLISRRRFAGWAARGAAARVGLSEVPWRAIQLLRVDWTLLRPGRGEWARVCDCLGEKLPAAAGLLHRELRERSQDDGSRRIDYRDPGAHALDSGGKVLSRYARLAAKSFFFIKALN